MSSPSKISLYSLSDLKTTLDDHLPIFLSSPNLPPSSGSPLPKQLRFTPSHNHTFIRLALGYTSVLVALYLFYLDYYLKVPFRDHKVTAAWCGLAYFILNGALTLWIWLVEASVVFKGSRKDGASLEVYSLAPHRKYDPVYRMLLKWKGKSGKQEEKEVKVEFTKFFSEDGLFVPARFEDWLRVVVPVLWSEQITATTNKPGAASTAIDAAGSNGGVKKRT